MATRGAKPKSAHLRIIDGTTNVTRHGSEAKQREAVDAAAASYGRPLRPTYLKGQAAWAWKRFIDPASWLDGSREALAIAFCELWQEFLDGPKAFPAAKHGQLRAYMSELGLTDERNRSDDGSKEEPDEFFGTD